MDTMEWILSYIIQFIAVFIFSKYNKYSTITVLDEYKYALIFFLIYFYYSGIDYFLADINKILLHY